MKRIVLFLVTNIAVLLTLGIVANLCDDVAVLYGGKLFETGTCREIFKSPANEYTKGLISAVPGAVPGKRLVPIDGVPVNRADITDGCAFCSRCKNSMVICTERFPGETALSDTHRAWCWMNELPEGTQNDR